MPTLPYKIGIFAALTAAVCSVPLVFDLNTVLCFNELFVTTDIPEDKDLETPLEVCQSYVSIKLRIIYSQGWSVGLELDGTCAWSDKFLLAVHAVFSRPDAKYRRQAVH